MNKFKFIIYIICTLMIVIIVIGVALKFTDEEPITINPSLNSRKSSRKVIKTRGKSSNRKKRRSRRDIMKQKESKGLVEIDVISDRIRRLDNSDDKIDLLEELWQIDDPALPKLVLELLDDKDAKVRLEAMELLNAKERGEILKCIEKALDDPDENVRVLAVTLLDDANGGKTEQLLVKAIDDSSEDVRAATFDVIESKSTNTQENIYNQSISSPYSDVKELTVESIMDIPSHSSVNILFRGLNDNDSDIKDLVVSKLDFLFSREFRNYNEAITWWNKNKNNYDEELFED